MKSGSDNRGGTPAADGRWHGLATGLLLVWCVLVLAVGWWLLTAAPGQPDLLIALDRPEAGSWSEAARRWLAAHVEADWVYPWVLLAPLAFWLGCRVTLERTGWPWRLGAHVAGGTAFILGSQWVTSRLEAARPRAIWIRHEDVTRKDGAGENKLVRVTQGFHAGVGKPEFPGTGPWSKRIPGTTSPASSTDSLRREVVMFRAEVVRTADGRTVTNNQFTASGPTNDAGRALAERLLPMIEAHLNPPPGDRLMMKARPWSPVLDGLAYVAVIGLAQAVQFRRRLGEREKQTMLLESRLAESRWRVLRAQVQPHFLFNTLNGIAMLTRSNPRAAEEMLTSLSELLRLSLDQSGRLEIPLREELGFLDRYLELQQMRFGDRLKVAREIDPAALDCLVPARLLQPLVENAIRHGIEPAAGPGVIRVSVGCDQAGLNLAVEDSGQGAPEEGKSTMSQGHGIGLASVREQLAGLYGGAHEFTAGPAPAGGFCARIRIPARAGVASEAAGGGDLVA